MTERREMALYDATKNRVTPWFPVGPWTVDEATAGVTVHYAAFRGDPFEGYFPVCFTMTAPGATATVMFPGDMDPDDCCHSADEWSRCQHCGVSVAPNIPTCKAGCSIPHTHVWRNPRT